MKSIIFGFIIIIVFVLMGCASMYTVSIGENSEVTFQLLSDDRNGPGKPLYVYAIITKYNGTDTDISIPSTVRFGTGIIPVLLIGSSAFEAKGLKNVIIPDSVISIGDSAFASNQLSEIIIPNSVRDIGNNAFKDNQLINVIYPANIRTIGVNAFVGNPSLTNIPMTVQQQQQIQQQQQRQVQQQQENERQAQTAQQRAAEQAEYNRIVGLYRNAGQSFSNLPGTTWRGVIDGTMVTVQFHTGGIYQIDIGSGISSFTIAGNYRVSANTLIINQNPPSSLDGYLNNYESGIISGNTIRFNKFDLTLHRQ